MQYLLITESRWGGRLEGDLSNDSCLWKLLQEFCILHNSLSPLSIIKQHHHYYQHFTTEKLAAERDQAPVLVLWLVEGGDSGLLPQFTFHGGKVERVVCIFHLEEGCQGQRKKSQQQWGEQCLQKCHVCPESL